MSLEETIQAIMDGSNDNPDELRDGVGKLHRDLQVREKWYLDNVYPIVSDSFPDITVPSVLEDFMEWCKELRPTVRSLGWIESVYPSVSKAFPSIYSREGFEAFHKWATPLNITKKEAGHLQNTAPLVPLQFPKISTLEDVPRFLDWVRVRNPLAKDLRVLHTASETYTPDYYTTVWTEEQLDEFVEWLGQQEYVGIDTETTGLDKFREDIVGISFYAPHRGWYIPLKHQEDIRTSEWAKKDYEARKLAGDDMQVGVNYVKCLDLEYVGDRIRELLEDRSIKYLFHNYAYDYHIIRRELGANIYLHFDTQIGQMLLDESVSARLKDIATMYLGIPADTFSKLFGSSVTFDTVPILEEPGTRRYNLTTKYAALDAELTYKMWEFQSKHFEDPQLAQLKKLMYDLELPFQRICVDVEARGVKMDREYLENVAEPELYKKVEEYREQVFELAGKKYIPNQPEGHAQCTPEEGWKGIWNLAAPLQVADVLFGELGLPILDEDNPNSTSKATLKRLGKDYPIAKAILEFRQVNKLYNDFAIKLQEQITEEGRIHTNYRTMVSTGRMSSSDPNLQQMPSGTNVIRRAFIADDGRLLVSMDFSGQELRILAEISGDPVMYKIFTEGGDMHSTTATGIHNNTIDRITESAESGGIVPTYPVLDVKVDVDEFIRLRNVYSRFTKRDGTPNMDLINNPEEVGHFVEEGLLDTYDKERVLEEISQGEYCENLRENTAKAVNFSIVYGTTEHGMSESLDVSKETAIAFMDSYKETYPGVAKWMEETRSTLWNQGYVETLLGRKRRLYADVNAAKASKYEMWKFEGAVRQGLNSPIQGTAADMIKLATLNMQEKLKEYDMNIVLFVHDEIIFDVPDDIGMDKLEEISNIMCTALPLKCGMKSDIEVYRRWGERLSQEDIVELFGEEQ